MNTIKSMSYAAVLSLAVAGVAVAEQPETSRVAAGEVGWGETGFGPMASPIAGDFSKGKHISFIKFADGFKSPLHTHSNDYVGVVVAGQSKHYQPGKPETETVLGPGSHWFVRGGVPHISECLPGEGCIFVLYQDAAFDIHPAK